MIYSSNVYLLLGDWGALADVNTLVDVGNDPAIIDKIRRAPTGVGKQAVEQVILTHSHFDHCGILPQIRQTFAPTVYAYSAHVAPDVRLQEGQRLHCGDRIFEVVHTPGHSQDSICLYCRTDGVLFVGDMPVLIRSPDGSYSEEFVQALARLCEKDVQAIYFGHGEPITVQAKSVLLNSLQNVRAAQMAQGG
jgi:glyoxylase-like metal-dependent hydrolase (beta-lactamase superfamily II)